jgi:F-type H+-transporting ATPase subunit b
MPGQGGRAAPAQAAAHKAPEHCPGHGPNDPPPHVNWWHGLLGINNEKAEEGGFINRLLWRYHDPKDHCHPKNEPPPFLASVLNFAVLAFVIYRFGRKPLAEALVKRKQAIMQEIDNATRLQQEAEERLTEYEEKLEQLEDMLEQMKTDYVAQAEIEKKHLLAELEERRARMRRDAEFRIEQELKAARIELLQEAVRGAVAAAEQLLRTQATKDDLDRMAEEYLRAIPVAAGVARATSLEASPPGAGA